LPRHWYKSEVCKLSSLHRKDVILILDRMIIVYIQIGDLTTVAKNSHDDKPDKFHVALFRTKVLCALNLQWPLHAKFVNFDTVL